jgi:hypothetical protein
VTDTGPEKSDAAALRFLGGSAGADPRASHPVRPSIVLGFQDGSDTEVDSRSALGRSIRALAEVLAFRSRPFRISEREDGEVR